MSFFSKIKTELSTLPGVLRNLNESFETKVNKFGQGAVADFTPGNKVAEAIGQTYSLRENTKRQEEFNQRHQELVSSAINNYRKARESGNEEDRIRARKILEDVSNSNADFISDQLDNTVTNREVIASAGELMLTAVLGGTTKLAGSSGKFLTQSAVRANKMARAYEFSRGSTQAGKIGPKMVSYLKEAGIGSGFFALAKAQDRDATVNDIVHAAEMGMVVGPATLLVAKGAGMALGKAGGKINKEVQSFISNMEKRAIGLQSKVPKQGGSMIDKILSNVGEKKGIKELGADAFMKSVQGARQFKARWVDRFSAAQRMEDLVLETAGRPLKESEKVYRNVRLLSSESEALAESKVVDLGEKLRPFNDLENEIKAYLVQLDLIDRARLGQKVPGMKTGQKVFDRMLEMQDELRILADEIGPEKMQRVGQARQIYKDFQINELKEKVSAGLISEKQMSDLLSAHPNYIPHNVIMDMEEKALVGMNKTLNVSKTDIIKAVGSVRNIEDPMVATTQRTRIAERLKAKNKWLQELAATNAEHQVIPGMQKISSNMKPQKGFGKMNFFENGQKVTYQIPKDLEIAIKGTDIPIESGLLKLATVPANVLKKGATQLNLTFSLPNKFRDEQTALLTSKSFIEELAKKTGVSPQKVGLGSKELRDLYKRSGGYGASIFKEGDNAILSRMESRGMVKQFKKEDLLRPDKLIEKINEQLEVSTRLEVFKRGLERGLSPKDAALVSRDATVDFAKMGSYMQTVNKVVPFLNARVQGFVNLAGTVAKDPEMFARMQLYTSVYPTLNIHAHNRKYESYKNISDYYKAKYWIIMTGEVKTKDKYTGQDTVVPQFITIPKGEGQSLVSGPLQYYLDRADDADYRSVTEMLTDTLLNASPISFQTFGSSNMWSSAISQLGPLATIPVGLATNVHPYFGKPIVPEERLTASTEKQFSPSTPESTKALANIIGVPPAKLEFVLDSFGGLPQDIQTVADMAFGVLQEGDVVEGVEEIIPKLKEDSLSGTTQGAVGELPVTHAFVREASEFYGPKSEHQRKQKKIYEQQSTDSTLDEKEKANEIIDKLKSFDNKNDQRKYINSIKNELTPDLVKRIKRLQTTSKTVGVLKTTDPVDVRAYMIQATIDEMKQDGDDSNEIRKYLLELKSNGILTESVAQFMRTIQ